MRDEHFYTRAIELNPENAKDYYIERGRLHFFEKDYDKALSDFEQGIRLGAILTDDYEYQTCQKYSSADESIIKTTKKIESNPEKWLSYYERAYYYRLKKQYDKAISDMVKAIELSPTQALYTTLNNICDEFKTYNINEVVRTAEKDDLLDAYENRIEFAEDKIKLHENYDYWTYIANKDLDKIYELLSDKALAFYIRVNFYERIKDFGNAAWYCKKAINKAKEQGNNVAEYLYTVKLSTLYMDDKKYEKAKEIVAQNMKKPSYEKIKKELIYINTYANLQVDVLRGNTKKIIREGMLED